MSLAVVALAWMALRSTLPPATLHVVPPPAAGSQVWLIRLDTGKCAGTWRLDGHGTLEAQVPSGLYLVEFPDLPGRPAQVVRVQPGEVASLVTGCASGARAMGTSLRSMARPILEGAREAGFGSDLPDWARRPAGPTR